VNLSWLEVACLYTLAASQASQVVIMGCMYHNLSVAVVGTILVAYAMIRAWWAMILWKRGII
jgi:hypothetical protein